VEILQKFTFYVPRNEGIYTGLEQYDDVSAESLN